MTMEMAMIIQSFARDAPGLSSVPPPHGGEGDGGED